MFDPKKFVKFALTSDFLALDGAEVSFRSYTDTDGVFGTPGKGVQYVEGIDDKGRPRGKYFKLDQSHRQFVARKDQVDVEGKSLVEFLKNSPYCEGSRNAQFAMVEGERLQADVRYRILDNDKDATVVIEAAKRRVEAEYKALNIDDETLAEVATIIGEFGEPGAQMREKAHHWASKDPVGFLAALDSGDRPYKAVVRKAIADGVLSKIGEAIYWDKTQLGSDEQKVVSRLQEDEELFNALKERSTLDADRLAKKPGRPKKK